ncbi:MAG: hypothetical protein ACYCZR_07030 [Burkholderiales bacterium]
MSTQDLLCGDTVKIRWINSGVTPTTLIGAVYTGSETIVDSAAMVSSGDGHYYHLHTVPNTPGYYVAQTLATISGKPYKNRAAYRAVIRDVN